MNDGSKSDAMTKPPIDLVQSGNTSDRPAALALLFAAAIPASAAELMRVTFVRHGQSTGNASGLIDT